MGLGFYDDFANGLADAEKAMGEVFETDQGMQLRAIEVDDLTVSERGARGGRFVDCSVLLVVTLGEFERGKLADGSVLTVRGERVRVSQVVDSGDGSRQVGCGPVAVAAPRRR